MKFTLPTYSAGVCDINIAMHSIGVRVLGTWTGQTLTGSYCGVLRNDTHDIDDEITFRVFIPKGTYNFHILYHKNNDKGIATVSLDGVTIGTIDAYIAVGTVNNLETIVLNIPHSTFYTIGFKIHDKNVASSNHYFGIQNLYLNRTA